MINDADWVAEVRQWYFSSQAPDAQARANEVVEAAARRVRPATAATGRPAVPSKTVVSSRFADLS